MRKKIIAFALIMMLAVSAFALASCGGTTLVGEMDDNGKEATYTASKADEGDFVMSGTLIVTEDEQIVIDSELEKGKMTIEFIGAEGGDSEEEIPDVESAQAAYTAYVEGTESQAVAFGAGEYMIKVTVTEKGTTGDVDIEVKGLNED